jgi:precorrin-3B C17-methyltransferase
MSVRIQSSTEQGRIAVVGIGPGTHDLLPSAARLEIETAETVVGYTRYLDLIKDLIGDAEVFSTGMRYEQERVNRAVDAAMRGRRVCIVSSGDPGVYGMAGLVFESIPPVARDRLEVVVVPGITSATACAALLGAPLTHDFAVISLSDLLTDRDLIMRRISAAVAADFVIVIYNPRSKGRPEILREALDLIRAHRRPQTPVGIVDSAYREGQRVRITTLGEMAGYHYEETGMLSTLICGNSSTLLLGGRMVTPRGYEVKGNSSR